MTAFLARLSAWLVEPPVARPEPAAARAHRAAAQRPAEVAVLAAPADAHALAAGLALRLTRGVAVVGLWTPASPSPPARLGAPPTLAARRIASSLNARDLAARAAGRLVTAALPGDEPAAATAATRLTGAITDAPVVLAVGGPRGDAWDRVLVACDLVAVHAPDPVLADLAVSRLAEQGAHALAIDAPPGAAARRLARAGLALPGALDGVAAAAQAVAR